MLQSGDSQHSSQRPVDWGLGIRITRTGGLLPWIKVRRNSGGNILQKLQLAALPSPALLRENIKIVLSKYSAENYKPWQSIIIIALTPVTSKQSSCYRGKYERVASGFSDPLQLTAPRPVSAVQIFILLFLWTDEMLLCGLSYFAPLAGTLPAIRRQKGGLFDPPSKQRTI